VTSSDSQLLIEAWCGRRDRRARQALIERHLPLVRAIARRFAHRGEALEDLVQVGALGLIKAVDRFDPNRGATLGAYAAPTIAGEIRNHLRDRATLIRLPRDVEPSTPARFPVPLETTSELWPDAAAERGLERGEDRALLAGGLRVLPNRERRILHLRYYGGLSQRGIAAELGISQVHVSRLLRESLGRLRVELSRPAA
jgi:RNA polymerase sigma-B factor